MSALGRTVDRLRQTSLDRGSAGSGRWLAVFTILWAARFIRSRSTRREETVFRQVLEPGDSLRIDHLREDFTQVGP